MLRGVVLFMAVVSLATLERRLSAAAFSGSGSPLKSLAAIELCRIRRLRKRFLTRAGLEWLKSLRYVR